MEHCGVEVHLTNVYKVKGLEKNVDMRNRPRIECVGKKKSGKVIVRLRNALTSQA